MPPEAEVDVVVLNWNGAHLLPACISALSLQSYRDFRLVLVDNGSIDASARLLDDLERARQPEWLPAPLAHAPLVIRNSANLGFAEGNNIALRALNAPFAALLNNDAVAHPEWLGELVYAARAGGPGVGMVASTMLFAHRPNTVASAGIRVHRDGVALDRAMGLPLRAVVQWGTSPVFGPSAGAALYRRSMLRDVGLFDPRFFSYLEDADLAWRARSRGWRALHTPFATVLHHYSATGGHNSPFKTALIARNRVWLLYKNMPQPLLGRYLPAILRYELLTIAVGVASRNRHLLRGRLQGLRSLRALRPSRLANITAMRLHPSELDRLLSPPLSPPAHLRYRRRLDTLVGA